MSFTIIIALIISIVSSFAYYFHRCYTYWSRHGVPGSDYIRLGGFIKQHHIFCKEQQQKYGKIYGYYQFFSKGLVINDPDLVRDIMVRDFHIFPDHRHIHMGSDHIALNLFNLPGDDRWKRIRSIISPAFSSGKLKLMMNSMNELSDKLVENVSMMAHKKGSFDIKEPIGAFIIDVITSCAYGINADSINNPDHPIVANAKKVFGADSGFSLIVSVLAPKVAKFLKLEPFNGDSIRYFASLTKSIVEERKKFNENNKNTTKKKVYDFIQLMIDVNKDTNTEDNDTNDTQPSNNKDFVGDKTLTLEELTAQGILFFIAGYDTTGAALSHCIYYLCQNPSCQELLYQELIATNSFNHDSLMSLKYLNAVIYETLRMAPSLIKVERRSLKDYQLGDTGILIPAGTHVSFSPYIIHHDPDYFEDPDEFKPERFLPGSTLKHHQHAFIPFGGGPRACLGMRFAMIEMRMCLAKLVTNFKFKLEPNFILDYFTGTFIFSPKQVLVIAEKR